MASAHHTFAKAARRRTTYRSTRSSTARPEVGEAPAVVGVEQDQVRLDPELAELRDALLEPAEVRRVEALEVEALLERPGEREVLRFVLVVEVRLREDAHPHLGEAASRRASQRLLLELLGLVRPRVRGVPTGRYRVPSAWTKWKPSARTGPCEPRVRLDHDDLAGDAVERSGGRRGLEHPGAVDVGEQRGRCTCHRRRRTRRRAARAAVREGCREFDVHERVAVARSGEAHLDDAPLRRRVRAA